MRKADQQIADDLLAQQLDLFRLEGDLRVRAIRHIEALKNELVGRLTMTDLSTFNRTRAEKLIREAEKVISDYYSRLDSTLGSTLRDAGEVQARAAGASLHAATIEVSKLAAELPTTTFMERLMGSTLIQGAPTAKWWSKQADDLAFRFAGAVRQGLVAGETNESIVRRVIGTPGGSAGAIDIARSSARALVHSSVMSVANAAKLETFRQNDDVIKGVRQLSTLDGRTSVICVAYSGEEWDLDGNPINGTTLPFNGGPPRHWNCRSVLVAITKSFRELGLDINEPPSRGATRASIDGPVARSLTFDAFLTRKGKEFQDEVLGAGRADLWRAGKLSLAQLLDLSGNPLTIAQLKRKYR